MGCGRPRVSMMNILGPPHFSPKRTWKMQKRRRFKQTQSLEERLAQNTAALRDQAKSLPLGRAREHILRRITQNEAASHLCEMLSSPAQLSK
jgi:hypothetical protein